MSTQDIVIDLGATVDYINGEVTEQADVIDFDDKVALISALNLVKQATATAIAMLQGEMKKELEQGSRQVGTKVYARVPTLILRHDHDKIVAAVGRIARDNAPINPATGEVDHTADGERAAALMQRLYLAPSSKAKVSELDRADISRRDVITKERNGFEIKVIDLNPDEDADDE